MPTVTISGLRDLALTKYNKAETQDCCEIPRNTIKEGDETMVLILVGFKFSAWYQVTHKRSENGNLDKYKATRGLYSG